MTTKTANNYRYVTKVRDRESKLNVHIKEMIEMIKNEEVKTNLYVKNIKLSKHAMSRVKEYFEIENIATATKMIKDMLEKAHRIGSVLSYDGRINVLYAFNKTAIFLSPDLKTVVTVNRYVNVAYEPITSIVKEKNLSTEEAIRLHLDMLKKYEEKENEYMKRMLAIEEKVRSANDMFQTILNVGKGWRRKKEIRNMIAEQNLLLKQEGRKLFNIKRKKRYLCKSLSTLY